MARNTCGSSSIENIMGFSMVQGVWLFINY
jgi:hypothetical protein